MPFNAEPALEKLIANWITPETDFFIRSHGAVPTIDADGFTLSIQGLVDRPSEFTLSQLSQRFPAASTTATLTCAGNRRVEFNRVKKVGGVQWDAGAIGNAEWGGIHLSDLLKSVGIQTGARHVWFEGRDQIAEKGETFPFGGSIPLEKAISDTTATPGCLLASTMNGKPLTAHHGFPLAQLCRVISVLEASNGCPESSSANCHRQITTWHMLIR